MKVAIKNKSEMKYVDSDNIRVGDVTLGELANVVEEQNNIMIEFFEHMKGQHLVKKDTPYIIKLQDRLVEIDKLEIVAVEKLRYPLRMYDLIDGELVLNKKKVVAL
jgi:hypothetical protein